MNGTPQGHMRRLILALMTTVSAMPATPQTPSRNTAPPLIDAAPRLADPGEQPPAPLADGLAPIDAPPLGTGALDVSSIEIEEIGWDGTPARPQAGWSPGQLGDGDIALRLDPGEAMDATWVRREFERNGLVGSGIGADRIMALINRINIAFAENGYVSSGVLLSEPAATAAPGVLRLSLVYGRLAPGPDDSPPLVIRWPEGTAGLGEGFVRDRFEAALQTPINAAEIERAFRIFAEDPAIARVNAELIPGVRSGEAQLALDIAPQQRFDLALSYANDRSPSVGGERAAITASGRNLLLDGDLLTAVYGETDGLSDTAASYQSPFLTPRGRLEILLEQNDAAVIDPALARLDIRSESRSGELGFSYRLIDRPLAPVGNTAWRAARRAILGLGVRRTESEASLLGEPFSFSPGAVDGRTEVTTARLSGEWIERGVNSVWAASANISYGLEGSGTDIQGVETPDENFTSTLVQLNHARRLGRNWQFRGRLVGQWASGTLYSSERFVLGGERTVRGYRENLILSDSGVLGSLEFSRDFSFSGGRRGPYNIDWTAFSVAGFIDAAQAFNERQDNPVPETLASVGLGVTWAPTDAFSARLTYAEALEEAPDFGSSDIQDTGVHFRIEFHPQKAFRKRPS